MSKFISLDRAIEMTRLYRSQLDAILTPALRGKNILVYSETFDKTQIMAILNRPECTGLRIYYGMDAERKVHAILVATDAQHQDILPTAGMLTVEEDDKIIEEAARCPDFCPGSSPLSN